MEFFNFIDHKSFVSKVSEVEKEFFSNVKCASAIQSANSTRRYIFYGNYLPFEKKKIVNHVDFIFFHFDDDFVMHDSYFIEIRRILRNKLHRSHISPCWCVNYRAFAKYDVRFLIINNSILTNKKESHFESFKVNIND